MTQLQQPRIKLPKGFKLPNIYKAPWFMKLSPRSQRATMLAYYEGEQKIKNASKRDVETYAENPQNRYIK